MCAHAGRLRVRNENRLAIRMLAPSRSAQVGWLTGSRQTQASDDSSKVAGRQSRLIHALGCGMKDRSKALIQTETNIGRAPSPFAKLAPDRLQRRARQRLPPPSMPSRSTSLTAFISDRPLTRLVGIEVGDFVKTEPNGLSHRNVTLDSASGSRLRAALSISSCWPCVRSAAISLRTLQRPLRLHRLHSTRSTLSFPRCDRI